MDKPLEHAKAYLTVVFGFVVYAATRIAAEHPVLPNVDPFDVRGWLLLIVGLLGGYLAVSRTPNITRDPVKGQTESMVYRPKKTKAPAVVANHSAPGAVAPPPVTPHKHEAPEPPEGAGP